METLLFVLFILLLVGCLIWAVLSRDGKRSVPGVPAQSINPSVEEKPTESPEEKPLRQLTRVYAVASDLPNMCKKFGTSSLEGLRLIFELEHQKELLVYNDVALLKLQVYDRGHCSGPRYTLLQSFQKDNDGKQFHPYIQWSDDLEGYKWGTVYPKDYRTEFGRKIAFKDLPLDSQIFICKKTRMPLITEFTLEE